MDSVLHVKAANNIELEKNLSYGEPYFNLF